jgi:dTDP-glucose 4,6-dehydratase
METVLVTGGAGFIGANFIRYILGQETFKGRIINLDKLTYAANLQNLVNIERGYGGSRYFFEKADITNFKKVFGIFKKYEIDTVVHFAAETHVDRSINRPDDFIHSNVIGTFNLLEAARQNWGRRGDVLFHHISTDEVYGSIENGFSREEDRYLPNSPYAASKASSDHLARAYFKTYHLPVTLSNCSNNYGPYQYPEKLIPLIITNALAGKSLPVYAKGDNVRDWLYVEDHCDAVWRIINHSPEGEAYNIAADNLWKNIDLVNYLCENIAALMGKSSFRYKQLISYVEDRPGHDFRYALSADKIKKELGWRPLCSFEESLKKTISWYAAKAAQT